MKAYTSRFDSPVVVHYNVENLVLYVTNSSDTGCFSSFFNLYFSTNKELFDFLSVISHDNNVSFTEFF